MTWRKSLWVFLVFLVLGILHAAHVLRIDVVALALFILAGLPFLLPLLAQYVETIKAGKEGFEAKLRSGSVTAEPTALSLSFAQKPAPDILTFGHLSTHARRILKSLWVFQLAYFGKDPQQRWGFGAGSRSSDFHSYHIGLGELLYLQLVFVDSRGLSFLTNEGMEFCKKHAQEIDAEPLYYRDFASAH